MSAPSIEFAIARSNASSGRTVAKTSVRIGMPSSVMARPRPVASPVTSHAKYAVPSARPSRLWVTTDQPRAVTSGRKATCQAGSGVRVVSMPR